MVSFFIKKAGALTESNRTAPLRGGLCPGGGLLRYADQSRTASRCPGGRPLRVVLRRDKVLREAVRCGCTRLCQSREGNSAICWDKVQASAPHRCAEDIRFAGSRRFDFDPSIRAAAGLRPGGVAEKSRRRSSADG
jgi:hypothetical protein